MITIRRTLPAVLAAVAVAISACGGGGSPGAGAASAGREVRDRGIPNYEPSTVVSHSASSRTLHSPDPVNKVSAFYVDSLDKRGWETVSKSLTKYSANLTVKKAGKGASISIATAGTGSTISISTYPSP
jgi:hypothetical protein